MSSLERRSVRKKASAKASGGRAFVSVVWNGKGFPIFKYDVGACDNPCVVQHIVMQQCAEAVETIVLNALEVVKAMKRMQEETAKVQEAKDKRSEELSVVDEVKE